MSSRPTRRAAARRKPVVQESSSESEELPRKRTSRASISDDDDDDDKEDTYTPKPAPTPRRTTRRAPSATPSIAESPAPAARTRRTRTTSSEPAAKLAPRAAARGGRKAKPPPVSEADEDEEPEEEDVIKLETGSRAPSIAPNNHGDRETTPTARPPPNRTLLISPQRAPETPASAARTVRGSVPPSVPPSPSVHGSVRKSMVPPSPSPGPGVVSDAKDIKPVIGGSQMPMFPQAAGSQMQRPGSSQGVSHEPIKIKKRENAIFEQTQEPDLQGKPRLVITHLVLVNFKSYAGRQEVGPFHPSFSSVVGPNGSGKSNVIDSLLFVFGFRASKMRQAKVSALIHNSANYPNLDFCEVEVHFQQVRDLPNGQHEWIPDSKLLVSRRAFKNNSSKYYLNGKTSDYKEVTTLLKGLGIDLDHKRFLILQGEVESIAQMKPKAQGENDDGLLEYLEDIIGTSKYKQGIEESSTKVDELNEVCIEKSSRVQHVEKERNSLEDKKNIALEYIKNENDLVLKKSALYQIHIADSERNVKLTSEMILQLDAEMNADADNHREAENEIKRLQKTYKRNLGQAESFEEAYKAIQREASRQEKETVKFQEKEKFLANKQKKLQKSIQTNTLTASEATSLMKRYTSDVEKYAGEVQELTERLEREEEELERVRDSLKEKTAPYSNKINELQESLEPWKTKINEKQQQVAVTKSELDLIHEKANASARAREEVQAKMAAIEESKITKQQELKDCLKERKQLEKKAKEIEAEFAKMVHKEPEIRDRLSGARQKADEARASLSAAKSQGDVLTGLMRLKESGRIEGFHGRLGNLGTIDAKYDIAISTAAPALENMVVDTVEVGQQCIEYLRKNNIGRAQFICLDRLPKNNLDPINTPENVPRLFDLIKPKDPRLAPAFYSVIKNTLVATDLQQANRIAFGARRWRVVTLDGQLIDVSGTMSGGGTSVSKGRMSSKLAATTSKEAVAKLEVDRDELERQYSQFQQAQRQLELELRDLNERIPELGVTISKIELEMKSADQHMADAQRRLKELEANSGGASNADVKKMKDLENKISSFEAEIEELEGQKAGIEEEIKVLQDKILEIGGIKLRGQKAKVDDLKEQRETVNEMMSAADMNLTKATKQKAKAEKQLANEQSEIATISEDLEQLQEDLKEHKKNSEETQERAEKAQEALEEQQEQLAQLKQQLDEVTENLNKTRAARIEMENRMEEYQKSLVENRKRSKHWRVELSKLKLQNISDFDADAGTNGMVVPKTPKRSQNGKILRKKPPIVNSDGEEISDSSEEEVTDDEIEEVSPGSRQATPMDDDRDEEMADADADADAEDVKPDPDSTIASLRPASGTDLPIYTEDELADMDKGTLNSAIAILEEKISRTNIDISVLAEYRKRAQEYADRKADLDFAITDRDTIKGTLDDLRKRRLEEFMTGFNTISLRLKEMYQMITMGGNAELELVDSLDPFSEGILFSVMPPKKSWKNISNLSGGEKTLSSLALVFALHHYKPTPLYVMDEIDAALDFRNVSIVASYIKERTKNAQFIVISLRNNMFELAARLVGVYKVNHMTKSVTIENKDYIVKVEPKTPAPATQAQTQAA